MSAMLRTAGHATIVLGLRDVAWEIAGVCPATASTTASTRGGAPLREYSRGRRGGELAEGLYLWLITNLVWTAVSAAAAAQPIHLFVDEGWHLLQYAGTAAELGAMARRFRKHYAAIHLATQFGQDLARNSDAEVIHDAVGIVTLFEQCMLRCKAGLQNLYNSINDLLERNGLQSTNLRHHQAMTGRE
jgi:acid phosphatase family membrane protein YuiD